jgi:hypothetical protein
MFAGHEVQSVQMIHLNLIPQLGFLSYRGLVFGNMCLGMEDGNFMPHRERLPLHLSHAFILLASKLGVDDVPEATRKHAEQLHKYS